MIGKGQLARSKYVRVTSFVGFSMGRWVFHEGSLDMVGSIYVFLLRRLGFEEKQFAPILQEMPEV